jgi:hypothetical protein
LSFGQGKISHPNLISSAHCVIPPWKDPMEAVGSDQSNLTHLGPLIFPRQRKKGRRYVHSHSQSQS